MKNIKLLPVISIILVVVTTWLVMHYNNEDSRSNFEWAYEIAPLMKNYKTSEDTLFVLVEDHWIKIIKKDGKWELPKLFDDRYYSALNRIKKDREYNLNKPEEN